LSLPPDDVAPRQEAAIRTTIDTVRRRLALLGFAEPIVIRRGDAGLRVEIFDLGEHEIGEVRAAIERLGQLTMRATHSENLDYWDRIGPLALAQGRPIDITQVGLEGSRGSLQALRQALEVLPPSDPAAPPSDADIVLESTGRELPEIFRLVLLEREVALTGDTILSAELAQDEYTHRPHIALTFDAEGAELLCEMSRRYLDREVAILIDDSIVTRPLFRSEICGGRARIDLGSMGSYEAIFTEAEAIVIALNAGAYPARLELESMVALGPLPASQPTSAPSP
jgi:preprotein translocase subunit SecD